MHRGGGGAVVNKIRVLLALLVVLVPLWGPASDPPALASPQTQAPSEFLVVGTISSQLDESTSCQPGVSGCSAAHEQSSYTATTASDGSTSYHYSDTLSYTIYSDDT